MNVYLVYNSGKELAQTVCLRAAELLCDAGASVILPPDLQHVFSHANAVFLPQDEAFASADTVITVGGDGTFLHTAKECMTYEKPILGINLGRTGFLATCEPYEMPKKLAKLAAGMFEIENRVLLEATSATEPDSTPVFALNDIVVCSGHRIQAIDINVYCDDILVNHWSGDGVIISSPTGSTAYSLSAGGPILDARIEGLVVTPICAHSLQAPAMVFAANRKITIRANSNGRNELFLTSDGEAEQPLSDEQLVHVRLSKHSVKLITFNPADQFNAIDKKLRGR